MAGSRSDDQDRGTMERMGRSMGRSMGGMAGKAADAAAGVAGSMILGAADMLGGWWAEGAAEAARSWDEALDQRSRQHFQGTVEASGEADTEGDASADVHAEASSSAPGYGQARPYYQLGHTARQNPEYEARNFADVEPDLRQVAEQGGPDTREWPDVRGYVQFGYEQGDAPTD